MIFIVNVKFCPCETHYNLQKLFANININRISASVNNALSYDNKQFCILVIETYSAGNNKIKVVSKLMRFQMPPFRNLNFKRSVASNICFQMSPLTNVLVWTEGENASKFIRFHIKTYYCGRYLK